MNPKLAVGGGLFVGIPLLYGIIKKYTSEG